MKNCPFESKTENCEVVVQDNKLVHIFDWNVTAPFQASTPVVEVSFQQKKMFGRIGWMLTNKYSILNKWQW